MCSFIVKKFLLIIFKYFQLINFHKAFIFKNIKGKVQYLQELRNTANVSNLD
jgi:hypothetical protein